MAVDHHPTEWTVDGPAGADPQPVSPSLLARAVTVLDCLAASTEDLGLGELARRTGLSKSTTHRLLGMLIAQRLAQQSASSKRYRLGPKMITLGTAAIARLDYVQVATPHLERVADLTGDTVHLAVLDGDAAYYIAKVEGSWSLRMPSQVGRRINVNAAAVGKMLLAFASPSDRERALASAELAALTSKTITERPVLNQELDRVRRQGFAVDDEEVELGLRCVAAPVHDHTGAIVAAVSVSGPIGRMTDEKLPEMIRLMTDTGKQISSALGWDA